ncbi:hypothetical protein BCON_1097g00010 [Botryotinia convoluta]|uniref:Amine oxidase domain-containing protein n=1 Tax=Botryotinia convoluta TaxID=54673 RepID=A0A4Z1H6L1_9HELO|nr:hypothetical protein BCON_1097g00010 [Botryotinia convoluta]
MEGDFSYVRNQWASEHATRGLKELLHAKLTDGFDPSQPVPFPFLPDGPLPDLPRPLPRSPCNNGRDDNDGSSTTIKKPKVAIIGAGAAGLFTAMILGYLNDNETLKKKGFNVSYEIFEAAGKDRMGGRLFTYNFMPQGSRNPAGPHDYYDVGAMRFPDNKVMTRMFDLFAWLKMEKKDLCDDTEIGSLVPYYIQNINPNKAVREPWCFNNITKWGGYTKIAEKAPNADAFGLNTDTGVGKIPINVLNKSPDFTFNRTIDNLREALKKDLAQTPPGKEGFKLLLDYDKYSTRQFLAVSQQGTAADDTLPPFNYETIEFLETFNGGTNWYDQAHSETVLESLDFEYSDEREENTWWAVLGGATELAKRMAAKIDPQPSFNSRITAIRVGDVEDMEIDIRTPNCTSSTTTTTRTYNGVFNTTTLSCLQRIDTTGTSLNYTTRQAIRSLGYGPSAKAGIKFKRAWWIHDLPEKYKIKRGGLGHSDLSIRTCIYPSYNINDSKDLPAILECSYTWQQDAERIGALMSLSTNTHSQQLKDEAELKELLLRDLARMHSNPEMSEEKVYTMISELYLDHFAHDWTHDPNTTGAFAFFRPQQFTNVWNKLIHPGGNLLLIGEASSPHHAWVVGALESAVHGVTLWLKARKDQIVGAADAVKILQTAEEGIPFVGMPPYVDLNMADWAAVNAKIESANFVKQVRGGEREEDEMKKFLKEAWKNGYFGTGEPTLPEEGRMGKGRGGGGSG